MHFKGKGKLDFKNAPDRTGLGSLQGLLTKQAQAVGKAQERWCVLSNEFLIYYENEAACLDPNSSPKGLLNLRRVDAVETSGNKFTLTFDKPSGVAPRVFHAPSEKDAARWTRNITRRLEWLHTTAIAAGGLAGSASPTSGKQKTRDKLTFRCFEITREGRKDKLFMRELVLDKISTKPRLTIKSGLATSGTIESRNNRSKCLDDLSSIANIVKCNVGTDAKMYYFLSESRNAVVSEYRFPDVATRDNFCYSVHLLQPSARVFEEGQVVDGSDELHFQVKYIFRNRLSRTGVAILDLKQQTMTLNGFHFVKGRDVRVRISPKVQTMAHPTKPLHLLIGCEGGFDAVVVDIESNRVEKSADTHLSELDIKFPSVVLRERFAGRLRAMGFGVVVPSTRELNHERLSVLRNVQGRVSVWTSSFNAAGKSISSFKNLDSWLPSHAEIRRVQYDIFCISLQESKSFPKWAVALLNHINGARTDSGPTDGPRKHLLYQLLCSHSIGAIHLLVFVRQSLASHVSQVIMSKIPTGAKVLGMAQGNKGAVGCTFLLRSCERFCFIACHLNARAERVKRRNRDFVDIYRGISMDQQELCNIQMVDNIDYVFWIGDLNYRTEMRHPTTGKTLMNTKEEYEATCKLAAEQNWEELTRWDQLRREMQSGSIFAGFEEHPIAFAPTYRMEKNKPYKYGLKNPTRFQAPSYCDRILWHHNREDNAQQEEALQDGAVTVEPTRPSFQCTSYVASHDFVGSDHRAVVATFELNVRLPYVNLEPIEELGTVNFWSILPSRLQLTLRPEVNQTLKETHAGIQVEFFAPLVLATPFCSHVNGVWDPSLGAWTWLRDDLPTLIPYVEDGYFLRGRQITVIFRARYSSPEEVEAAAAAAALVSVSAAAVAVNEVSDDDDSDDDSEPGDVPLKPLPMRSGSSFTLRKALSPREKVPVKKSKDAFADGAIVGQASFRLGQIKAGENSCDIELNGLQVTREGQRTGQLDGEVHMRSIITSAATKSAGPKYASVDELEADVQLLSGAQMLDSLGNWEDDDDDDDDELKNDKDGHNSDSSYEDTQDFSTRLSKAGALVQAGSRLGVRHTPSESSSKTPRRSDGDTSSVHEPATPPSPTRTEGKSPSRRTRRTSIGSHNSPARGTGRRHSISLEEYHPQSRERLDSDRRGSVYDTFGFRAKARSVLQLIKLSSKAKENHRVSADSASTLDERTEDGADEFDEYDEYEDVYDHFARTSLDSSDTISTADSSSQRKPQRSARAVSQVDFRMFDDALASSGTFDVEEQLKDALNDEVLFVCKQQAIPLKAIAYLAIFFLCLDVDDELNPDDIQCARTATQEQLSNWLLEGDNQFPIECKCETVDDATVVIGLLTDSGCIGSPAIRRGNSKHDMLASSLQGVLERTDSPTHKALNPFQQYRFMAWKSENFEELTCARLQTAVQRKLFDLTKFVVQIQPPTFSASSADEESDVSVDPVLPPPMSESGATVETIDIPSSVSEENNAVTSGGSGTVEVKSNQPSLETHPEKVEDSTKSKQAKSVQTTDPSTSKSEPSKSESNPENAAKKSATAARSNAQRPTDSDAAPNQTTSMPSTSTSASHTDGEEGTRQGFLTGTTDVGSALRVLNNSTSNSKVTEALDVAFVNSVVRKKIVAMTPDVMGVVCICPHVILCVVAIALTYAMFFFAPVLLKILVECG